MKGMKDVKDMKKNTGLFFTIFISFMFFVSAFGNPRS
jgi:hypothetical protein